jgi:hypothetical protein
VLPDCVLKAFTSVTCTVASAMPVFFPSAAR